MTDEIEDILALQHRYALAVLERGDLPQAIIDKWWRFQELSERRRAEETTYLENRELFQLTFELLPHFHFRIDDVNWRPQ